MRPRPIEGALPRDDERPDGGRAGRPGPADPAHLEGVRSRRSDEGHQPGTSGGTTGRRGAAPACRQLPPC